MITAIILIIVGVHGLAWCLARAAARGATAWDVDVAERAIANAKAYETGSQAGVVDRFEYLDPEDVLE